MKQFLETNISFKLKDPLNIEISDVYGDENSPPVECSRFTAEMIISNQSKKIKFGYQPIFCCHVAHVTYTFAQLIQKNKFE